MSERELLKNFIRAMIGSRFAEAVELLNGEKGTLAMLECNREMLETVGILTEYEHGSHMFFIRHLGDDGSPRRCLYYEGEWMVSQ